MNEKLVQKLVGYDPEVSNNQQYVIWCMEDDEYNFLYETCPPQVCPLRWAWKNESVRFRVFCLFNTLDMEALAAVWNHSSRHHESTLKLMTVGEMSHCFEQAIKQNERGTDTPFFGL